MKSVNFFRLTSSYTTGFVKEGPFLRKEQAVTVRADNAIEQFESNLAEKVGAQRYNVWFKNATSFTFAGDFIQINTPNHFVGDWIERNLTDAILETAREVTGKEMSLSFAIDPDLTRTLRKKQPDKQLDYANTLPERDSRSRKGKPHASPEFRLKHRLGEFVVGASNQLAFAAAQQVVENPGRAFNPLFVHGGCGLGKTHLLQGICNGLQEKHPGLRMRYVTGEEFTNDYIFSIRAKEPDSFRSRYRHLDLLVIDDVHFFANKKGTQDEFLHTFNAIDAAGKQIVLASDVHPRLIGQFSESLTSRFVSGMVVRIDSPDVNTRLEFLRRKAEKLHVSVREPVLRHIAELFIANIRELEGALVKVVALAQMTGEPITVSLAERAIRDLARQTTPIVMLSDIESIVAIFFGLNPADLHTSRKTRTIALARGVAMYLARKRTAMSYPEIGRFMGNKNHSTVILATRRISNMLQGDETATWITSLGPREEKLAVIVRDLEEQLGAVQAVQKTESSASQAMKSA